MSGPKVELVLKLDCKLGEGPHWDHQNQTLLLVDIDSQKVLRWNPTTKELKTTIVKEPSVGAVVPRRNGGLVVAAGHRLSFLDEATGELKPIQSANTEFPQSRFNDGKCDPAGRFWAGTMGLEKSPGNPRKLEGALFCLDTNHEVTKKVSPVDISNGLSWTSDNKTMYYCDSLKFTIDAYDYDITTGDITNMRPIVTFDRETDGIPDGHCIDTDGNLWVAMFFTGKIIKVDPRTGQKLQTIKVSDTAIKTTSVCFAGTNLDEMYVTSARNSPIIGSEESDESGGIFKITGLGARGTPVNIYEG